MNINDFKFHTEEMSGDRTYITSNLEGFRLIIQPGQNAKDEIEQALKIFYPLYLAASATTAMTP